MSKHGCELGAESVTGRIRTGTAVAAAAHAQPGTVVQWLGKKYKIDYWPKGVRMGKNASSNPLINPLNDCIE